jgi:2-alkyl-3-oxoalkanoate reductase
VTRVAIVGASGFIGGRAAEMLVLRRWAKVTAVVRSYGSAVRIARLAHDFKIADALSEDQLTEAFTGCDFVFLATVGDERTIIEGPGVAARAARRAGVKRIVYLSSGMVYGFAPPHGADDESPPNVDQPWGYNRRKALAERTIPELRKRLGVDIVVLRPTIVYGPRSAQFTVQLARQILAGEAYLVEDGRGVCNAVYVDNLVTAMWQAAVVPEAANETFVISDAGSTTWQDLYLAVADAVGAPPNRIRSVSADAARSTLSRRSSTARLDSFLRSPWASRARAVIPRATALKLKAAAYAFLATSPSAHESEQVEGLDSETLSLQLCPTRLPIAKAQRILEYKPLPTEEGFRRTGAWLRSAGFHSSRAGEPAAGGVTPCHE